MRGTLADVLAGEARKRWSLIATAASFVSVLLLSPAYLLLLNAVYRALYANA